MNDYEVFIKLLNQANANFFEYELTGSHVIRVYTEGNAIDFTFSNSENQLYMID